jgi:hypothetical protein
MYTGHIYDEFFDALPDSKPALPRLPVASLEGAAAVEFSATVDVFDLMDACCWLHCNTVVSLVEIKSLRLVRCVSSRVTLHVATMFRSVWL